MYSVYKHTAPNGKIYIGITSKSPEERWKAGYRSNKHFTYAINKYGWENIKHEVLFNNFTKEQAEQKEIELIALYNSTNPDKGYNIAKGGHSNSGYKHSVETKNKIRKSLLGVKHSKERVLKNSNAKKAAWKDETYRNRMSEAHIGKQRGKNNVTSKTVFQYSKDGILLNIFESTGEAQRATGIDSRQIRDCCLHKQATCHGFIWSYEEVELCLTTKRLQDLALIFQI